MKVIAIILALTSATSAQEVTTDFFNTEGGYVGQAQTDGTTTTFFNTEGGIIGSAVNQ